MRLQLGTPMALVRAAGGEVVGHVADGRESALEHCIVDGYRFMGRVIAVDGDSGTAELSGHKH